MAQEELNSRQTAAINSFIDVGRIPDYVKGLNFFDGKPTELISWITEVEEILLMYRDLPRDCTQYGLLLRTIRRKIVGEASDVLNANNILSDWPSIKSTLILYYRDKRDLKTLDSELTAIRKLPTESLSSYFSRVNELLNAIIAQVQMNPAMNGHTTSHIDYFREKALDSFIRGLERNLSLLLKTKTPTNLNTAYQFCLEYYNMDIRTAPFQNQHSVLNIPRPRDIDFPPQPPPRRIPPVPLRRPPPIQHLQPLPQRQFFQPQVPRYQPFHQPQFLQRPFQPRQFLPQKPLPKPEPMEVDQSIRSRNINYGNRPDFKRPRSPSNQMHQFKRQAHPIDNLQFPQSEEEYRTYFEDFPQDETYDTYENEYYDDRQDHENANPPPEPDNEPQPSTSKETNFLEWKPEW